MTMDEQYLQWRKEIERFFAPKNKLLDSRQVELSPSGNFQIEIHRYSTDPTSWNYSRGIITQVADGKIIADVKRNYGHFWYAWVTHPNGKEYLLCGEDYQGQSLVNLTTGTYQIYFPESGYKGAGFCWAAVYPSPDSLMLAVDGCYWAYPYDLVFYDFHEPENLPYRELLRIEGLDGCEGWIDNEIFALKREIRMRKSDGALYDLLTDEEQEILANDESLVEYRYELIHCKRPSIPAND